MPKHPQVTFAQANARRLARHGLAHTQHDDVVAAARALAGVHAQVMSAAEVSLGLRVTGVTRTDVQAALWEDRSLVKTFGPRGTVHLLPAADLGWWLAALGSVPAAGGHVEGVRLTAQETDEVCAALDAVLREGDRTTAELDEAVAEACGAWAAAETMPAFGGFWPRWRQALRPAAARGLLCYGPPRGRTLTYASPSHWVPDLVLPDPAEATDRLLAAYLAAYGPATPDHLARWLATTPAWATALFERAELDEVELDGERAWVRAGDAEFAEEEVPPVRLLPYFDAFAVGGQPRDRLYPGRAAQRALAGSQAGNFPVVLRRGVVGGVWHQKRSGTRVHVTVEPLGDLSGAEHEHLEQEVARLGEVLRARPTLTVGEVTVGAHA